MTSLMSVESLIMLRLLGVVGLDSGSSERRRHEPECWHPMVKGKCARTVLGFFGPFVGVPDDEQCGYD
jgi:hypothetical protein